MINNVITQNFTYTRWQFAKVSPGKTKKKSWKNHGIFSQKGVWNPALSLTVFLMVHPNLNKKKLI